MEQFLWVEEYRPRDIESCVLPKSLKTSLQSFVNKETLPNLILSGGPGVGKTTAARAMLEQIGATYMMQFNVVMLPFGLIATFKVLMLTLEL